jgi:hypothetical protein
MGVAASSRREEQRKRAVKDFLDNLNDSSLNASMYDAFFGEASLAKRRPDDETVKHVQYLATRDNSDGIKKFDAAVLAGILEVSDAGGKAHTIEHLQRKAANAVSHLLPVGSTAAFERHIHRLSKALLVSLTDQLSPYTETVDDEYRPDTLSKGMRVQRGPDW